VPFLWHVADCAEKAISYLKSLVELNKTHAVRWPDIVVLDIAMPGESGLTVLQYMRDTPELRLLPVVIFSGHPEPKLIDEAYRLGANSFLAKPVKFEQTVELVGSLYTAWSTAKRPTL